MIELCYCCVDYFGVYGGVDCYVVLWWVVSIVFVVDGYEGCCVQFGDQYVGGDCFVVLVMWYRVDLFVYCLLFFV